MKWIIVAAALVWSAAGHANDWDALRADGAVALMRHALAPGTDDPPGFALGDCGTQRNLDERGRDQARAIGAALRERGLTFDRVYTSQWCRCRETAELMGVGEVVELPPPNSYFGRTAEKAPRDAALREFLLSRPADERSIFVTHQVNVRGSTGRSTTSGQILVGAVAPDGRVSVTGSILIRP